MEIIYAPQGNPGAMTFFSTSYAFIQAVLQRPIYIYENILRIDPVTNEQQYRRLNLTPTEVDQKIKENKLDEFDLVFTDIDLGAITTITQINQNSPDPVVRLSDNRTNPVWIKTIKDGLAPQFKIAEIPENNHYQILANEDGREFIVYSASEIHTFK